MIKKTLSAALAALAFAASPMYAQQFTNGSLTGSLVNGGVPPGWTLLQDSPDTNDPTNAAGGGFSFGVPGSFSPNGGTFVGIARSGDGFVERFGQTLTGLTVGQSYNVSWYAANFGFSGYMGSNYIQMLVGGVATGAGGSLAVGTSWFSQSTSFTATSTNAAIAFQLGDTPASYLQMDGISLSLAGAATTVPEPASFALVGLGLGVVGFVRRKRNA